MYGLHMNEREKISNVFLIGAEHNVTCNKTLVENTFSIPSHVVVNIYEIKNEKVYINVFYLLRPKQAYSRSIVLV